MAILKSTHNATALTQINTNSVPTSFSAWGTHRDTQAQSERLPSIVGVVAGFHGREFQ